MSVPYFSQDADLNSFSHHIMTIDSNLFGTPKFQFIYTCITNTGEYERGEFTSDAERYTWFLQCREQALAYVSQIDEDYAILRRMVASMVPKMHTCSRAWMLCGTNATE